MSLLLFHGELLWMAIGECALALTAVIALALWLDKRSRRKRREAEAERKRDGTTIRLSD